MLLETSCQGQNHQGSQSHGFVGLFSDNQGQGVILKAGKPLGAQSFSNCPHKGRSKCPVPAPALASSPVFVTLVMRTNARPGARAGAGARHLLLPLCGVTLLNQGASSPSLYPLNVWI